MKKLFFATLILFGIMTDAIANKSCNFCGVWNFDKFEYISYITTDCAETAEKFFKNSSIKLTQNSFKKTYKIDNSPSYVKGVVISIQNTEDSDRYDLIIKKDNKVIEDFNLLLPNIIYQDLDGCRFYFKKS